MNGVTYFPIPLIYIISKLCFDLQGAYFVKFPLKRANMPSDGNISVIGKYLAMKLKVLQPNQGSK